MFVLPNLLLFYSCARAEETPQAAKPMRVAVLEFDASGTGDQSLGQSIAEILPGLMKGGEQHYEFIERGKLKAILEEHALSFSGFTDPDNAVRTSSLLAAQVLLAGRAYHVGEELWISAKVFSAETGRVDTVVAKGPRNGPLASLVTDLAAKIGKKLAVFSDKIDRKEETATLLRRALIGKKLPEIAIFLAGPPPLQADADLGTCAQAEGVYVLKQAGFRVISRLEDPQLQWLRECRPEVRAPAPKRDSHPQVILVGSSSGQLCGNEGALVACSAQVELTAVDLAAGKLLRTCKGAGTGHGFSDPSAMKAALQAAAGQALVDLVLALSKEWPENR